MTRSKTRAIAGTIAAGAIGTFTGLVFLAGLFEVLSTEAWPHQTVSGIVYPPLCCNSAATSPTGDCSPIDDRYVSEQADGYHINLPVGAHPKLKTKGYSAVIPYSEAKKQPLDNSYHLCISEDGAYRYCFFPKPGAV